MVSDVYSHIPDEDRCKNAQNFEKAFYGEQTASDSNGLEEVSCSEKLLHILSKSPELADKLLAKLETIAM